jgi:hypothetical protein
MKTGLLLVLVACGGATAEAPVTVSLGTPRDQVIQQLEARHRYCAKADQRRPAAGAGVEVYSRCDRPGAEWGESWISATYDNNQLVELKRYERFADDDRAIERWNQLVGERLKITTESPEATAALRGRALEPGTRSMKAFKVSADTVVGVYLLTPTPPEDASILEAIVRLE